MADCKCNEQKEKPIREQSKGYQQRRKASESEITLKKTCIEILLKSLKNLSRIIKSQVDIKLRQFMEEELDAVLKKSCRSRQNTPRPNIELRKFDDILLRLFDVVYK